MKNSQPPYPRKQTLEYPKKKKKEEKLKAIHPDDTLAGPDPRNPSQCKIKMRLVPKPKKG